MAIQNQGWAYVSGSGTGTPGGDDTQVQYNDNGSLQGSSKFTFDGDDVTVIGDITATAFSGDGSGLTNISSDDVDTTTDTTNATRYIPFVDQATGADGESLLIHSAVSINPSTGVFTVAGSAPSLGIGSAVLVEADMEKIDGITNGTAAASKAVVLDASKNIATIGTVGCGAITSTGASSLGSISSVGAVTSTAAITAGTSFIIGSADLNEADMEQIDGVTAGTAAASKAVVLDASKNIATLGTVGCGAITSTGASVMGSLNVGGTLACDTSLTIDAVVLNATELGYVDGVTAGTAIASKAIVLDASKDVTGINNLTASFFKGDGSALTNLPGGGGGGGLLTAINGTQAYLTSSLAIGGSSAPDHTLSISGSISGSGIVRAASFAADGAAVLGGSLTSVGVVAGGAISSATTIDGSGDLTMGTITMTGFSVDADGDATVKSLISKSTVSGSGAVSGASFAADGAAVLGGSLTAVGVVAGGAISGVSTLDASGLASLDGGINVNGNMTVSTAGAIAVVGTIDGGGDLTMGTITMTGFVVDADGDTNLKSLRVDDNSYIGSDSVTDLIQLQSDGDIIIKDGEYDFDIASHDGTNGLLLGGTLVSATAAEINYLDDDDLTAADLTKLAAVTATAAEINYLDNAALTAADLTKLAAVHATAAQLNFNYNVIAGTAKAAKSVVLDASKDVTGINNLTASFFKGDGSGLTNLPGGGGGGGLLTAINGTQAYLTSSLAIGGSSAPDHTLSISGSYSGSAGITGSAFNTDGTVTAKAVDCSTLTVSKSITANAAAYLLAGVLMSVTGSITPATTIVIASPYKRVYLIDVNVLEQSTEVQLPALSADTDGLMITIKSSTTATQNYDITITGSTGTGDKIDNTITMKTLARERYSWSTLIADNDNGSWWQIGSGY